jgi:hypothetical protein
MGFVKKANTEAREAISCINNESVRNLDLEMNFYLIGIDASIKEGNLDRDMIAEGMGLATNDPAIILRSLMIDIQDFEVNRLNDMNVSKIIENKRTEIEEKIYEKFRDNKDICMYKENKEYLEPCYEKYIDLCRKKIQQIL